MIPATLALIKKLWDNRILVVIGIFSLLLLSFYIYYLRASSKIESLTRDKIELEQVVEDQKKAITQLRQDYDKIIQAKEELRKDVEAIRDDVEREKKKLFRENRKKKTLEELAKKKTSLIEKKINDATDNVIECFETISRGGDC